MADDQGKGKIVPRKGLFVQEHDFLLSIPSWDTFFHSAGGFPPPVQKSVMKLMDVPSQKFWACSWMPQIFIYDDFIISMTISLS